MHCRLAVAAVAAFFGGCQGLVFAQAAINSGGAGVAGTGFGGAAAIPPAAVPVVIGAGHIGAGTGGTGFGVGNVTGGILGVPRAATGGIKDSVNWGISTGGINGTGQGLSASTGGINDGTNYGLATGGINGSTIGAGSGGIRDLNSLGAGTGGMTENNAPRFRIVP